MDFYKRALELKDETVADRRYIHQLSLIHI